jgi:chromatin remodeling complex protein RSC6
MNKMIITNISNELAAFLEKGKDTDMVREIQKYIQFYQHHESYESPSSSPSSSPCLRARSKFMIPNCITDDLASFLGKDKDTKMTRIEITREINKYIMANHLQDKMITKNINPDAKLKTLFNLNDMDELTFFNLQKYISLTFTN